MVPVPSQLASQKMGGVVLALLLLVGASHGQSGTPFASLAGQWSGVGTIELSDGREPIKCRASYDVLEEQRKLQLNIRCASESYNFDLRASANYEAGAITGNWSESTRNASGTISGKAEGDRFQIAATGPTFTAELTLLTRGNKQSVTIKSQNDKANVKGASITLQRS